MKAANQSGINPDDSATDQNGIEMVSPRKELTSSAISVRSKSMGPGKQIYQIRSKKARGSSSGCTSQERSVSSVGARQKLKAG